MIGAGLIFNRRQHRSATAAVPRKASPCFRLKISAKDEQNAFFADGVQDEILTTLTKIAD